MIGLKKLILEQQDDPDKIKIKTFQDWLDINHPNWIGCTDGACTNGKQLNKGGGYGIWGDNSDRMWYFKYEDTKTYGDWFEANYDANNPASVLTKKITGVSSGGQNTPSPSTTQSKSEEVYNKYRKLFIFKRKDGTKIPITYEKEYIGNNIDEFLTRGFTESVSFLAGILSVDHYKNLIASIIGPNKEMEEYKKALEGDLKPFFECRIRKIEKGLGVLLEQSSSGTSGTSGSSGSYDEYVVSQGKPVGKKSDIQKQQQNNQQNYINRFDTLRSIVDNRKKPAYKIGERSEYIPGAKRQIGHTDATDLFDQSFKDALVLYQEKEGIPSTGQLDEKTICKIYPQLCEQVSQGAQSGGEKSVKKPQSEVLNILNTFMSRFSSTEIPSKENCKILIDNYAYQAKNYRKNKEVGIESNVTSQELTPVKKQINACLINHPVLKLQLRDMSEMKKSDSPFYLYAEPESSDQAAVNEIPNVLDKPLVISIKEFSTEKPDGETATLSKFRKDKDNKTLLFTINNNDNWKGKYVCGASTFENGGYGGEQVKMTKIGIDTLKKICRKLDYSLGISYYTSNDPDETPQYGKLYEFTKNGNKLNFKFKEQNNEDYYFNCGGGEKLIYSQKTKKTIRIGDDTSKELQNKCGFLG